MISALALVSGSVVPATAAVVLRVYFQVVKQYNCKRYGGQLLVYLSN